MVETAQQIVTVFGGSGFIGRYVVQALARRGYRIRVAVRNPNTAGHLQPLGAVGQIHAVQANVRYPQSVIRALEDADYAINLTGILYEKAKQSFHAVHTEAAAGIARAAAEAGLKRFVHMSAIGAQEASPSAYAKSKAAGEREVLIAFPDAAIIRPSIVYGPEDDFFNRFAAMARLSPVLPLIGGGQTQFQPVYVGDVAEVIARGVDGALQPGSIYELGGPDIKTFRQCLELMLKMIYRRRVFVNLPWSVAKLQARLLQLLPRPLLTVDQVLLLQGDNIVSEKAKKEGRDLAGLGITPRSMELILPTYLSQYRVHGQFETGMG